MAYRSLPADDARAERLTVHHLGTGSADLRPTDGTGPTAGRSERLFFDYRLEDEVSLERFVQRNLERWTVSVSVQGPGTSQERSEIASAHVLIVNLEPGRDVRDFTDRASGAWLDLDSTSRVQPESRVLVLDRVWLRPDHRGEGLGPIIAAAVIDRLGRGCDLAACYPAPLEAGGKGLARDASIEALGRIWSQVGFRHWSDGVWMLDLNRHGTRAALAALIAQRAVAATPTYLESPDMPALRADQGGRHDKPLRHDHSSYRFRAG